jgi:hypothetical protein
MTAATKAGDLREAVDATFSPCPFCGSRVDGEKYFYGPGTRVECSECGATSVTASHWNRRAAPPAETALAAEGAKPIIPNWFPDDRCQVCGWPLAKSRDQGCVVGDCSFRPQEGTESYRITQLRRKALAERADPAQSADTPSEDAPSEAEESCAPECSCELHREGCRLVARKGLHQDTQTLVRRFAAALAEKLAAAEQKYGYSNGWARNDWMDECRAHLRQHIEKGDPRDVAAYCAFLWHHGESTASRPQPARGEVSEAEVDAALQAEKDFDDRPFPARRITKNRIRAALEAAARVRADHFVDANKIEGDAK